jgi:hypothetical protein
MDSAPETASAKPSLRERAAAALWLSAARALPFALSFASEGSRERAARAATLRLAKTGDIAPLAALARHPRGLRFATRREAGEALARVLLASGAGRRPALRQIACAAVRWGADEAPSPGAAARRDQDLEPLAPPRDSPDWGASEPDPGSEVGVALSRSKIWLAAGAPVPASEVDGLAEALDLVWPSRREDWADRVRLMSPWSAFLAPGAHPEALSWVAERFASQGDWAGLGAFALLHESDVRTRADGLRRDASFLVQPGFEQAHKRLLERRAKARADTWGAAFARATPARDGMDALLAGLREAWGAFDALRERNEATFFGAMGEPLVGPWLWPIAKRAWGASDAALAWPFALPPGAMGAEIERWQLAAEAGAGFLEGVRGVSGGGSGLASGSVGAPSEPGLAAQRPAARPGRSATRRL